MSIDNTAELVNANVKSEKAKPARKPAPALSPAHTTVKQNLDALSQLRKVMSDDNPAIPIVVEQLINSIEAVGGTVARGNTLYIVRDGVLSMIDLTPGTLVRV